MSGTLSEFGIPERSESLAFGRDGALWFTELDSKKIARMTIDGHVREFAIQGAKSGPFGIAAGTVRVP
jgi:streptogramin lyase